MVRFNKTFDNDAEAEKFITEYYEQYHPAGYGTWCKKKPLADGKVEVHVSRGSSCD